MAGRLSPEEQMNALLQELTADELQECARQLDGVLESHSRWLGRLHEAIICRLPPQPEDLREDAHRHCQFGRWYHENHHPALAQAAGFREIGDIHARMHASARLILLKSTRGEPVTREEYAAMVEQVNELRQKVYGLGVTFTRDLGLISRLADKIFEYASEGVMITDPQGRILNVNRAFTEVTGYTRQEVAGKTPGILNSGRQPPEFYRGMWRSLTENGHWQGEIWNRRKNGEIYLEWLSISAVKDCQGQTTHYVAIFSDITTVKENEARLHTLAYYDALTGLPNRLLFQDRLQQALTRAARDNRLVALMLLDLDRFKIVNDTLGHSAGDALLVDAARRIGGCVRDSDTVARLGGDEFTVILPDVADIRSASKVAQKIVDSLSVPFTLEGHEVFVTTSIGISLYPISARNGEALVKAADIAMYRAKEQGRNNYQFYRSSASAETTALFTLENHLRRALERNELKVFYQPQVEIETGLITGVEALLRWEHPDRGTISPCEFIPLAEETGLIVPIGEWVLREACRQNKAWQDAGIPPLRVAVNVSARQLKQKTLAEKVAEILDDTGLLPEWLELELTESIVMQNAEEAIGLLNQLKSLGVWLSIDDFGTGYSSLSYLKRFPIDTVKIDRSFISGVTRDGDDAAISHAIITLANSLKLKVIAEGVETRDQLVFLREHQCCDAQGYFFSRPLGADQITRLLREKRHLGRETAAQ
jgi:diguanylate cyclase (GGDEF)-like protein/PAS domain S-box-containing protein